MFLKNENTFFLNLIEKHTLPYNFWYNTSFMPKIVGTFLLNGYSVLTPVEQKLYEKIHETSQKRARKKS